MFGYVIANCNSLSDEERVRFRSLYCGMCHTLHELYGNTGRMTLSYDMTFLALVLSALYEPEEKKGTERCMPHPFKPHPYALNEIMAYAAGMNVALAYHKCADNWDDDRNPAFAAAKQALKPAYSKVKRDWPEQCAAIEQWIADTRAIEASGLEDIDPPMNLTGAMLGTLFRYRADYWGDVLYRMGDALGRFIYFMDAYEDLEKDIRRKRYNPLRAYMQQENYESFCKDAMTMMLADCTFEFEQLPIVLDADLIRNVLYSGVWAKYNYLQAKKDKSRKEKNKGAQ